MHEGCPSDMSSASSFHVIRSIPYVGGPRGCRCPMTRRHPMSASALRLAVPLHSLSYRCVAVRIHCTSCLGTAKPSLFHPPLVHSFPCQSQRILSLSILIPATRFLSVSSRVEAPRTYHIPLGSAPFNTLPFFSISQLCRSYPWCRICVYGSRGQSSLATSSHSKRPLPLLRHWNRPRRAP